MKRIRRAAQFTSTPDNAPPQLLCPACDRPLVYRQTVISGVKPIERWDYFACSRCGPFVYRSHAEASLHDVNHVGCRRERRARVIGVLETLDPGAQLRLVGWVELNHQHGSARATRRRDEPASGCGINGRLPAEQTVIYRAHRFFLAARNAVRTASSN